MKQHRVVVWRHGGPDVPQEILEDAPEPEAGVVRVKVVAAVVSAFDIMVGGWSGSVWRSRPGLGSGSFRLILLTRSVLALVVVLWTTNTPRCQGIRPSQTPGIATRSADCSSCWRRARCARFVAERISLVDAARAHQLLERGRHASKLVLVSAVVTD